ncbi:PhzF family phenazine biosynthesis protein [Thalassococcus sp. S3]|uniref:PhzF family phenazine biosynthesis protein n=1 Tax=Thalassococcus sp. S3 TaxID=2017482 RepID=UPI0010247814|nr:PhzF family phenazine biosynthesis protein [Thalassococcus sp. S3]QBF30921.1 phenazine biosynthesis protein PhzF [Thalassococcus sp. S3]
MRRFKFDWVDAFSTQPFGGNGCAVVHDAAHLDADTCMAFVRETGLVECTFVGPSETADIHVRYFLASREIPFAGHPTLATVAALQARGHLSGDEVVFETGAGRVPVTLTPDGIEMVQVKPVFGAQANPALVAAAVGLCPEDIVDTPQIVSTGLPFCITLLRDHDALRRACLVPDAWAELARSIGADGLDVMEPFLVTLTGASPGGDTFSRLLLAPPSPPEDPFTGSATGAMAAYLWARGHKPHGRFVAEQGHWMGRPGRAEVSPVGAADALTGVRLRGQAYVLMQGDLNLP